PDSVAKDSVTTVTADSLRREQTPADSPRKERISIDSVRNEPTQQVDSIPLQTYLRRPKRLNNQASILYRPGPSNNIAMYPVKNGGASSCLSNRFQSCTDITTNMVIINGMVASRVNSPTISKAAQNSSAKMASPMDSGPPRPNRS